MVPHEEQTEGPGDRAEAVEEGGKDGPLLSPVYPCLRRAQSLDLPRRLSPFLYFSTVTIRMTLVTHLSCLKLQQSDSNSVSDPTGSAAA